MRSWYLRIFLVMLGGMLLRGSAHANQYYQYNWGPGYPNGITIPKTGTVTRTFNVTQTGTLSHVMLGIDIPVDGLSAFRVVLEHPDGTQITLLDEQVCDDNVLNMEFDDAGVPYNTLTCNNPFYFSPVVPEDALSLLDGKSTQGLWKLHISDIGYLYGSNFDGIGQIIDVQLKFSTTPDDYTTCADTFTYSGGDFPSYYGTERAYTWTYCPEPGEDAITAAFNSFSMEDDNAGCSIGDRLQVYDGDTIGAWNGGTYVGDPLIGSYCGDNLPPAAISSTAADGCLTFLLHSNHTYSQATPYNWNIGLTCDACGNGIVNDGEECDDGNSNDNDACTNSCETNFCGDGHIQSGEACDDGNLINSDGCTSSCTLTYCGDGIWQDPNGVGTGGSNNGHELCDNGPNNGPNGSCSATCTLNTPVQGKCGDGVVDPGEECDDAGEEDGNNYDECTNRCTIPRCGDGIVLSGSFTPRPNGSVSGSVAGGGGGGGGGGFGGDGGVGGKGGGVAGTSTGNNLGCIGGSPDGICETASFGGFGGTGESSATCIADCGPSAFSGYHEGCDDGSSCADGSSCLVNADCSDHSACVPRDGDGCSSICEVEYCGDGLVNDIDEVCDSGTGSQLGCDMNTGIPGGGANDLGAHGEAVNSCTWIEPVCKLNADPKEFYLNGTTNLYFTHTPTQSGMSLSKMDFGDGNSQSISSSPMSHAYANSGAYTAKFTVTNVGTSALAETCYDSVYVYRCGDGFLNGPEECDGIGQAECGVGQTCSNSCVCIVNGQCGVASGAAFYSTTGSNGLSGSSAGICSAGTVPSFSYNSSTKKRGRTCQGTNGGSNMSCTADNTYCGNSTVEATHGEACDGFTGCTAACAWDVPTCNLAVSSGTISLSGSTTLTMSYANASWFLVTNLLFGDGKDSTPSTTPKVHFYDVVGNFFPSFKVINKGNGNISTTCSGTVHVTYPCGDGVANPGEECNEPGLSCSAGIGCNTTTCLCEPTPPLTGHHEDCDVGQFNDNNERCNTSCQYTYCGDGLLQDDRWIYSGSVYLETGAFIDYTQHGYSGGQWVRDVEECDGQCSNGVTCLEHADCIGVGDGLCLKRDGLGCSDSCSWELCGDSIVQTPNYFGVNEICDEGRGRFCSDGTECTGHPDACTLGPDDCSPYFINNCAATCEADRCGDGVINTVNGEECDYADGDPRQSANAFCYPAEYELSGVGDVSCQRTSCGDGITQNINIGGYTNADGQNEECDQGLSGGNGCTANCQLTIGADGICNLGGSIYDANDGGDGLVANGSLCLNPVTFDPTSFEYNSSTHTWTWDCLNLTSTGNTIGDSCSVQEKYCGDGYHDQQEQCEPSLNPQCASNCTSSDIIANCNSQINLPYLSSGAYDTGQIITAITTAQGGACWNGTWNGTVYHTGGISSLRAYICYGTGVGPDLDEECHLDAHYCGDGILDDDEECDDGDLQNNDGCSTTCDIEYPIDVAFSGSCIAEGAATDANGIGYLPQINNDEYLPIRWQLTQRNDVDIAATDCNDINTATSARIPGLGMQCTFDVVRAGSSSPETVYSFTDNCIDPVGQRWDNVPASLFASLPINGGGITALGTKFLDPMTVLGFVGAHFGQYRVNLTRIDWTFCNIDQDGVMHEDAASMTSNPNGNPASTPPIEDQPICAMNLSISDGYLVQKGSSLIEVPNTDIGSTFMSLEGVNLVVEGTPLDDAVNQISKYSDVGREHLVNQIIEKYDSRAIETHDQTISEISSTPIRKVPTSAAYFVDETVVTLDTLDIIALKNQMGNDPFIFVMPLSGSRLIINGSLGTDSNGNIDEATADGMFVVNGVIEFSHGTDCSDTDYVAGIFIASQGFDTTLTSNTNLNNPERCEGGNLIIKGLLVGAQATLDNEFSFKRRSTLDAWKTNGYLFDDSLVGEARKTFETCYLPSILAGVPYTIKYQDANSTWINCNHTNRQDFRGIANELLLGIGTTPSWVPTTPSGNRGRNHICQAYRHASDMNVLLPAIYTNASGVVVNVPPPVIPAGLDCDTLVVPPPPENGGTPPPLDSWESVFIPTGPWYRQAIKWTMEHPVDWQCKKGSSTCLTPLQPLQPLASIKHLFEGIGNPVIQGGTIRSALYNGFASSWGLSGSMPGVDMARYDDGANLAFLLAQQGVKREDTLFEGASVLIETNPDLRKKLPAVANEFLRSLQISK